MMICSIIKIRWCETLTLPKILVWSRLVQLYLLTVVNSMYCVSPNHQEWWRVHIWALRLNAVELWPSDLIRTLACFWDLPNNDSRYRHGKNNGKRVKKEKLKLAVKIKVSRDTKSTNRLLTTCFVSSIIINYYLLIISFFFFLLQCLVVWWIMYVH